MSKVHNAYAQFFGDLEYWFGFSTSKLKLNAESEALIKPLK
jgi:hypothetical protein